MSMTKPEAGGGRSAGKKPMPEESFTVTYVCRPKGIPSPLTSVQGSEALLSPTLGGRGDQGGSVEVPAHPKPSGVGAIVPLNRRDTVVIEEVQEDDDGNWDDQDLEEEDGLREGSGKKLGGEVDMEDDAYLEEEDEEEDEVEQEQPQTSWQLLARYYAQNKPSSLAMFDYFEGVWRLRTGLKYKELQKHYYMVTLFSQGDFEFVKRGGPWIFNQNALLVKAIENKTKLSETILDAVPVWVRIYDVPWGKQNEATGLRWGNQLGNALEVDVPDDEVDKNEFLRVRVELPYDRRLQTQLTIGVKGKPAATRAYKMKYERVPYYCEHCGFMGHRKEVCEKRRRGVLSLDYGAHKLQCSPYKKFEHRAKFVSSTGYPAARRGLSFASFGSADTRTPSRSRGKPP